uniref:LRRCT domain-containing protein n=1 Tax=Branchiostoma floridae TaxID=7739 RepID=C3YR95_BRAFL|eukprot:XP_002601080.1 hypothetical protein BRAFLDRAFT_75515 [Branchiostoma floridae]
MGRLLEGTCILCTAEQQQQPARIPNNSSRPISLCIPDETEVVVRGVGLGVLSIQKLLPPQKSSVETSGLALVECGITDLEQDTLSAFPALNSLQLDANNLTHVKRAWFDSLKSPFLMRTLSLSHNNISIIDPTCFQNLTLLSILLLDNNSIQNINPSWFSNLKWLGHLSLSSNLIQSISPQAFKPLKRLTRLDLNRNALTCLSWETMNGLHKLDKLAVGGDRLLALDDSSPLVMNWHLDYTYTEYTGQKVAVRVNQTLFCITQSPKLAQYHVRIYHNNTSHLGQSDDIHNIQCTVLGRETATTNQVKYVLPFVAISVEAESCRLTANIAHLCTQAWKDAYARGVALGGNNTTLKIISMGVDKAYQPQTIAVVFSNNRIMSYDDGHSRNISTFGHDEMVNVTCHVETWGKTYRHVFHMPVSSTSNGTLCKDHKTQTTRTLITKTTKAPVNQASATTTDYITARTPKEPCACLHVQLVVITVLAVVGVELVALLVACAIRKQRCCSRSGKPQTPALASLNHWALSGVNDHAASVNVSHLTGAQGTAGDDPEYSEIPDEYYNTRHPYWEIPDEYYYENTRPLSYPLALRVPGQGDGNDAVPFYAAVAAEVALPPSARLGGKHPSYSTVPRTRSVPQIHARQRKTNIRSYGVHVAGRYRARDMAAIGRYGRTRGARMSRGVLYNNPSANRTIH